jgi:NTP pyrophosphatase (non-canonical NTP hydrolase)
MNVQEYLLACLSEELAEVQQCVSKCQRFTPHHTAPGYPRTNFEELKMELSDVFAITGLLRNMCGLAVEPYPERMAEKIDRTLHYMETSIELGALDEISDNRNDLR